MTGLCQIDSRDGLQQVPAKLVVEMGNGRSQLNQHEWDLMVTPAGASSIVITWQISQKIGRKTTVMWIT